MIVYFASKSTQWLSTQILSFNKFCFVYVSWLNRSHKLFWYKEFTHENNTDISWIMVFKEYTYMYMYMYMY